MEKVIERIVRDNPQLDGAEVITATITSGDKTRKHYYIFKKNNDEIEHLYARIPINVLTKENGKSRNRHYIVVAVTPSGYEVYDLNKPRSIKVEGTTAVIGDVDEIGCNIPEDKMKEPLPF
jgi:hypothetical protein